jgi:3-oxoacyl-[acyl-carrier protein] reductase
MKSYLMFDYSGQTAIITGGTRGIGAAISRALLAAGARVRATYAQNEEAAQDFAKTCVEHRDRLSLHRFDVADPEAVASFFASLDDEIQILINNAGIRQDALLGMMPYQAWNRVLQVNLSGAFYMCKHAMRAMMSARYGRIVNIVSPSGRSGFAGQTNYAAAKAGLQAMTRSLALEVATLGITVNCVMPGFVRTQLIGDLPEKKLSLLEASVPMKRFGQPEEVAAAVCFLSSREASYITGATLEVTGGA